MTEPTGGIEVPMTEEELANAVPDPIEDTPLPVGDFAPADTETAALEDDGNVTPIPEGVEEVITRDGGTSVSAAYRVAAGLDPAGE